MKKKTIIKIMTIALMAVMISTCLSNVVLAGDPMSMEIPTGSAGDTSAKFNDILNIVLGIVQVIGIAIAVIMLIVLAIKYISAAPSDKADIKKSVWVYVVGAIVLFGAAGILQIIKGVTSETVNSNVGEETGLIINLIHMA